MLDIITAVIVYGGVAMAVLAAISLSICAVMLSSYAICRLLKIAFMPW